MYVYNFLKININISDNVIQKIKNTHFYVLGSNQEKCTEYFTTLSKQSQVALVYFCMMRKTRGY